MQYQISIISSSMETKEEITWSRWKPTKRQKEILEELFKQCQRNRSRSQINEFTNLLKQHGNVEAKNVFYWFQNTRARNKRKQKKETRQNQRSRFETTPQGLNEKDTVKSLDAQTCSSPTKADRIIVDSSKGVADFSAQGDPNSAESASSTSTQKLLSIDLSWKQHLQSVGNETFSEPYGFTRNMWNEAGGRNNGGVHRFTDPRRSNVVTYCSQEHEKKYELLELFPLHTDGNLRSKCNSCFQGQKETNNISPGSGEWLSLKFVP